MGGRVVRGALLEQALVGAAGLVVAAERDRERADAPQHAGLQRGVGDAVDDLEVRVEQLGAALRLAAEALEVVEGLGELGLVAGLGERLAEHGEGAVRVAGAVPLRAGHAGQLPCDRT